MYDFKAALKDSLHIATERFKKADADVREMADAVATAINSASGEALRLALVEEDIERGLVYKLVLAHKAEDPMGVPDQYLPSITEIFVTVKGYPIEVGEQCDEHFLAENAIESKAALEAYFAQLASSSDSPLVHRAATLMALFGRKKEPSVEARFMELYKPKSLPAAEDLAIDEDNVPF